MSFWLVSFQTNSLWSLQGSEMLLFCTSAGKGLHKGRGLWWCLTSNEWDRLLYGHLLVRCVMFLFHFWNYLLFWKVLFYLFERLTERIFHLWIHSPNGCNGQDWAKLKPGTYVSILASPMTVGSPAPGPSFAAFPGVWAGSWIRNTAIQTQVNTWIQNARNASTAHSGLTRCATMLVSQTTFLVMR